ncbi:MAG: transporter substrate-binding domain-containing protein [Kaiparowitsia implicata GSE-PSE-MK54-09C]|jgi:polar amino acid transport system substrate-binding protein|nr:transporter substrate-binding domain-containing protein [Kaiparowitsia implicata GSE-PSE-MK54-09C]
MRWLWLALLLVLWPLVHAEPLNIRICHDREPLRPWRLEGQQGLDFELIRQLEPQLAVRFEFVALPWKRCLLSLEQGRVDGAMGVSFSEERSAFAMYPLHEQQPHAALRMRSESYVLYRRKGTAVRWQEGAVVDLHGVVGIQHGYSAIDFLQRLGVPIDSGAGSSEANLYKLLKGRIGAAVLLGQEGDYWLRHDLAFHAALERVEPPLQEKHYYLVYSRSFYERHTALVQRSWQGVAVARDSAIYRQQLDASLQD